MGPTRRQVELARERETFRFVALPPLVNHSMKLIVATSSLQIRPDLDIELETKLADKPHPVKRTYNLIRRDLDGILSGRSLAPKYL